MPRTAALVLLPLLALSACASPEARLRTGLHNAGLSPRMSTCMADYMVQRLSLVQLRRISALASLKDADYGKMSMDRLVNKLRALKDSEILAVSSKAALACAIDI
jgi:hypothetical protein